MPAIVEPVLRTLRKARETMRGDTSQALQGALAEISQLRKRLGEIEAELEKHSRRFVDYYKAVPRKI